MRSCRHIYISHLIKLNQIHNNKYKNNYVDENSQQNESCDDQEIDPQIEELMMTLKNLDEDQRNILAEIIGIDVN